MYKVKCKKYDKRVKIYTFDTLLRKNKIPCRYTYRMNQLIILIYSSNDKVHLKQTDLIFAQVKRANTKIKLRTQIANFMYIFTIKIVSHFYHNLLYYLRICNCITYLFRIVIQNPFLQELGVNKNFKNCLRISTIFTTIFIA